MENKFEIDRQTLIHLLDHYRSYLLQKYPKRLVTQAFRVELQRELDAYQQLQAKRETYFIWKMPVKVLADSITSNIDVEPAVEVSILDKKR